MQKVATRHVDAPMVDEAEDGREGFEQEGLHDGAPEEDGDDAADEARGRFEDVGVGILV